MFKILLSLLISMQINNSNTDDKINFHSKMADKYYHIGDFPNMIYHLQQKIKLDPHDVNSYSDLAYYYWSMSIDDKERKDEFKNKALNYLKIGLEKNKDSAYMYDELANFHLRYRDYKTAKPFLLESIKKNDSPMTSYHMLVLVYLKENEIKKAIETLEICVKKFPSDAKAKSKLHELKSSLNGG